MELHITNGMSLQRLIRHANIDADSARTRHAERVNVSFFEDLGYAGREPFGTGSVGAHVV
jgi:hypothetical protein